MWDLVTLSCWYQFVDANSAILRSEETGRSRTDRAARWAAKVDSSWVEELSTTAAPRCRRGSESQGTERCRDALEEKSPMSYFVSRRYCTAPGVNTHGTSEGPLSHVPLTDHADRTLSSGKAQQQRKEDTGEDEASSPPC